MLFAPLITFTSLVVLAAPWSAQQAFPLQAHSQTTQLQTPSLQQHPPSGQHPPLAQQSPTNLHASAWLVSLPLGCPGRVPAHTTPATNKTKAAVKPYFVNIVDLPTLFAFPSKFKNQTPTSQLAPSQVFTLRTQDYPKATCKNRKLRGETSGFANQKAVPKT